MIRTAVVISTTNAAANGTHLLITADGSIWKRFTTGGFTTRWSMMRLESSGYPSLVEHVLANVGHYPVSVGPVLIHLSEEEEDRMRKGGTMPRSVSDRHSRVLKEGAPSNTAPSEFLAGWRTADEHWIEARTHPRGRLRGSGAAAAAPPPAPPAPDALRFDYPPVVKGAVRRKKGESYICRKIGARQDVLVLRLTREAGGHILAFGEPGTGKDAMLDAAFGEQMVTMNCSEDTELADFVGSYVERPGAGWVWVDGPVPFAMEHGLVLFVNEINAVRKKQAKVLHSISDGNNDLRITANPERGVVRAAPGFAIAAAINPRHASLDEALLSRFSLKIHVTTDYGMLLKHFGMDERVVGAASNLDIRRQNKELSWSPQARDLLLYEQNRTTLGEDEALGSLVNSAPEADRHVVAQVLSTAVGRKVAGLSLR